MKLLLISIMAFGLAMTSFAQQAVVKHAPEGIQVTVNVTVDCPCKHQVGPRHPFAPPQGKMWQHRRGQGPRFEAPPFRGPRAEGPKVAAPKDEQKEWDKTLDARREGFRRQMGPPPGRGRGFGGPPTNHVAEPQE